MATIAKITTEIKNNSYVVHMTGEIDISNLSYLESSIKPSIDNMSIEAIVLDCKDLMFIDSKVVGYFAYLYKTFSNSNRKIIIVSANETINDILTLVGLTAIIPQFTTIEEYFQNLTTVTA